MNNLYNLFWWDKDGNQHNELERHPLDDTFKSAMARLTRGPAAMMGAVQKVMVTDMDDFTNYLWEDGQLVFPTEEQIKSRGKG